MMEVTVTIYNPSATMKRICGSNDVGLFVASTWHRYFDKYTPMQQGMLKSNVHYQPFKVIYDSPYAHYMHEGIKYIDPTINASGWFDADAGRWFSHSGVQKIPTNEPLNYSTEQNINATSHWEVPAYEAFKDTVSRAVTNYLRRKS